MPVRRTVALLMGASLALVGCSSEDPESPTADVESKPASAPEDPTAVPTSAITCSSPMPSRFRYSSEKEELKALTQLIGDEVGSPERFDDVDADELALLIERGFVDPSGYTNDSPSMWEFHQFLCDQPEVRAIGFIAGSLPGTRKRSLRWRPSTRAPSTKTCGETLEPSAAQLPRRPCMATSSASGTEQAAATFKARVIPRVPGASRRWTEMGLVPSDRRMNEYADVIAELQAMQDRVRSIRTRCCEPKSNTNPRYLALSNVVSNLSKAVDDLESELA